MVNLIDSFQEFKEAESIDRPTLIKVLEDVYKTMIRKKYGTDEGFDVIVNDQTGDLEILRRRMIVEDGFSEDDNLEIELAEATSLDPEAGYDVGEEFYQVIDARDFGRRAILAAKQTLAARIGDLKKKVLMDKYSDRVGELITGEVYQIFRKETLLLDDEGNELILPKNEQIPADFFKKGEQVRAVIKEVEMRHNTPVIILSRTHPDFLKSLMEIEVPEIMDGLIAVKKIVREPGERAKVAVESYDDRIDPVGACVGMKGSRIHGIVRELRNENIDIINWTANIQLLMQRSLTPARINSMDLDGDRKMAKVWMDPDQVSLAIGKKGINIKLAQDLTGFRIDVFRDSIERTDAEFDIDLDEFADEIDQWVIDEFKKIGCDTALSVLEMTVDDLERRTDLERSTIEDVQNILRAEFESDEEGEPQTSTPEADTTETAGEASSTNDAPATDEASAGDDTAAADSDTTTAAEKEA